VTNRPLTVSIIQKGLYSLISYTGITVLIWSLKKEHCPNNKIVVNIPQGRAHNFLKTSHFVFA